MKVDFKLIGDRIKQIRKEKKISQEKLAEQLDVSIAYLSRVERGSSEINLKRIFDIATMLDVPVTYLIQGVSCKEKNYLNKVQNNSRNRFKIMKNIVNIKFWYRKNVKYSIIKQ